jgi:hypothetical protein
MPSDNLTYNQWMRVAAIYREMQGKTRRIEKRLEARQPPGTDELYHLNRRANDLMQELFLHCHYAGIQARRIAGDGYRPPAPETPPADSGV